MKTRTPSRPNRAPVSLGSLRPRSGGPQCHRRPGNPSPRSLPGHRMGEKAGAHRRSPEVRIGTPRRLLTRIRPLAGVPGARASRGAPGNRGRRIAAMTDSIAITSERPVAYPTSRPPPCSSSSSQRRASRASVPVGLGRLPASFGRRHVSLPSSALGGATAGRGWFSATEQGARKRQSHVVVGLQGLKEIPHAPEEAK